LEAQYQDIFDTKSDVFSFNNYEFNIIEHSCSTFLPPPLTSYDFVNDNFSDYKVYISENIHTPSIPNTENVKLVQDS
jgi:hypothetical protein